MLRLPVFRPTAFERQWIDSELRTGRWIRTLWAGASRPQRRDPDFMVLLARSAWINSTGDAEEAARRLRNRHLAKWLGLPAASADGDIARALTESLSVTPSRANWLVATSSGITHYYKPHRPGFLAHLRRHSGAVGRALALVSNRQPNPHQKASTVASILCSLPTFRDPQGGHASILNGLTPVVACLDPQRRFPIMNARTGSLLKALGKANDAEGAAALSRLVGQFGLRHSFDLDVYASGGRKFQAAARVGSLLVKGANSIGLKPEETTYARLTKRKLEIRKLHNALINRLRLALEWKYRLRESEYDALVDNWRPGRKLLIEAKTSTDGVLGRAQLRQAIGQLFDYRWRSFGGDTSLVGLALLTPTKPAAEILQLLVDLKIEALWFEGKNLRGTIEL